MRQWWLAWAASVVLGVLAVLRGLGDSTQALADAVLLHAVADIAAAVVALVTIRVVTDLTELLAPDLRPAGREAVLSVGAAVSAGADDRVAAGGGRSGGVGTEVG